MTGATLCVATTCYRERNFRMKPSFHQLLAFIRFDMILFIFNINDCKLDLLCSCELSRCKLIKWFECSHLLSSIWQKCLYPSEHVYLLYVVLIISLFRHPLLDRYINVGCKAVCRNGLWTANYGFQA